MDKTKIYGVEFLDEDGNSTCTRIYDAVNMKASYRIGGRMPLRTPAKSDFDEAYPFGAMRLCCLRLEEGRPVVIYEDEAGFARDGSAGNVMVEIPKFYSKRSRRGKLERLMVSGKKHPGFELEPAFMNNGVEKEFVYVGAYDSTDKGNGIFSSTGGFPDTNKSLLDFQTEFGKYGYTGYDLAIHLMLQKLIIIEFGTRYIKDKLGGVGMMKYYGAKHFVEKTTDKYVRVTSTASTRNPYFLPGQYFGFGDVEHEPNPTRRLITGIKYSNKGRSVDIYYSGDDLSGLFHPNLTHLYGTAQPNGYTDAIDYHTGRCDMHAPLAGETDYLLSPFKYRGIENIWGNVWEHLSGLKLQTLKYYYTFNTADYAKDIAFWNTLSFDAPEQNHLADHNSSGAWIRGMGYDPSHKSLFLPAKCGSGAPGLYYDSVFYSFKDKDYHDTPIDPSVIYTVSVGGGYDHGYFGSLFTYRCFMKAELGKNWLYGCRVVVR